MYFKIGSLALDKDKIEKLLKNSKITIMEEDMSLKLKERNHSFALGHSIYQKKKGSEERAVSISSQIFAQANSSDLSSNGETRFVHLPLIG